MARVQEEDECLSHIAEQVNKMVLVKSKASDSMTALT